jgi:hypothetical protein
MATENHIKNAQEFNEVEYTYKLLEMGFSPEEAEVFARRTAEGRNHSGIHNTAQAGEVMESFTVNQDKDQPQPVTGHEEESPRTLALSPQQSKIVNTAVEIYDMPASNSMAFMHAVFCHVGLPRSKVDGREFMRRSGAAWLNVQAGYLDEGNGPVLQPLPYGALPRLALAHVSTQAIRHRTREIPIGDSAAQFLSMMGMDRGEGGRRYSTLRKQMHALAACRLQLGFKGRTFNGQPIKQFDAWQLNKDSKQRALWPGLLVLSEDFYNSLLEGAVPLDLRALHALKGSALALDTYIWLAHRLHRIEGQGVTLQWRSLREQFAQEYIGPAADKNFKNAFLTQLKKVLAVYPEAKVTPVSGGLLLRGSPSPIPPKVKVK